MAAPRRSQKQIAQRYGDNLLYNKTFHWLRGGRVVLGLAVLLIGAIVAALYLWFGRTTPRLEWFNSPGPISQAHAFFGSDCRKCHAAPAAGANPLSPALARQPIDASCLACHAQHTFHQPDVVVGHSCVECHHEHLGPGPMPAVANINCATCHANKEIMSASAQKAAQLSPAAFPAHPVDGLAYFDPPRPAQGYTRVIHAFDGDHPDFQIQREHLLDPDTLKFDHKIHLTGDIPMVNGHKLDCRYCHQPDNRGAYMQAITFAANCQACHALQVDPTLADFQIPHPRSGADAAGVRAFLLTLPTQYATYAAQQLHMTDPAQISAFVGQHMQAIRERTRRGDDLVRDVFFSDGQQVDGTGAMPQRSLFPGCAYCHQVEMSAGAPAVTPPVLPDRWYVHARFDHAAHKTLDCESCHAQARQSELTSDVLLPARASCVTCHSAKGGVASTCTTCHNYHNTAPAPTEAASASGTVRGMLLDPK